MAHKLYYDGIGTPENSCIDCGTYKTKGITVHLTHS
jgi:hypothetical protein